MRKSILALATTALLGIALVTPALADVTVTVFVDKFKRVTVEKDIDVTTEVNLFVVMGEIDCLTFLCDAGIGPFILGQSFDIISQPVSGTAEALAIVNQVNTNNNNGPPGSGFAGDPQLLQFLNQKRRSQILGSILGNGGILGVNQDSGDDNNQGNVVAVAFTDLPDFFISAEAGGEQINTGNTSTRGEEFPAELIPLIAVAAAVGFVDPTLGLLAPDTFWGAIARIANSVNSNTGIVGVNQSAGDKNNQANLVAAAIGADLIAGGDPLALSEGMLGQVNSGNRVVAANTFRKDELIGSVNNNTGIVGVNQTAGVMNNQIGVINIAATQSSVAVVSSFVGVPGI